MKRLFAWVFAIFLVLVFAVMVVWRVGEAVMRRTHAAERTSHVGPVRVVLAAAEPRDLSGRVELSGSLRSETTVDVVSDVPGRVRQVEVSVGDRVAAGALLAKLEGTELSLAAEQAAGAVAAAAAAEATARQDAVAAESLAAQNAMAPNLLVAARARQDAAVGQLRQAKAALALAQERARDTAITSPIAGLVTSVGVDRGQMVAPGMPVFQVQDDAHYEVAVGLDETSAYAVRPGQEVTLTLVARPGVSLTGRVATVASTLDRQNRKAAGIITLDPTTERLITGSTVLVAIDLAPRAGVVMVPESALLDRSEGSFVRVVDEAGAVRAVTVHPGAREAGWVEVDALTAGTRVVTAGPKELPDGTLVEER